MVDSNNVMKALVSLAIEKTLLNMGGAVFETVADTLYKKYHCYIPDCYEKPEYLKVVLNDLYGASYKEIINTIDQHLHEFKHNKEVKAFLQAL